MLKAFLPLVLSGLILLPHVALAQSGFNDGFETVEDAAKESGLKDDLAGADLPAFIRAILVPILSLVAIIALATLILGGFMYIISIGKSEEIERAKKIIIYSIIGLIVIGISAVVVNFVLDIFVK